MGPMEFGISGPAMVNEQPEFDNLLFAAFHKLGKWPTIWNPYYTVLDGVQLQRRGHRVSQAWSPDKGFVNQKHFQQQLIIYSLIPFTPLVSPHLKTIPRYMLDY